MNALKHSTIKTLLSHHKCANRKNCTYKHIITHEN